MTHPVDHTVMSHDAEAAASVGGVRPVGLGVPTIDGIEETDAPNRGLEFAESDDAGANGKEIFTFWRGRVALYAILKSLGIGAGDHVLVPGYTCFAVPSAVQFTGAEPLYADIEPDTYDVSLTTVQAALDRHPSANVRAIVIQHTHGLPADTDPIVRWARERGIYTIEDCAHAWGSRYRAPSGAWLSVGSLGDAAFHSSQWTKPISTGVGGWASASGPQIRRTLRKFRAENCEVPSRTEVVQLAAQLLARRVFSHPRLTSFAKACYQALYSRGVVVGTSSAEELHGRMSAGYAKRMSGLQEWLLRRELRDDRILNHRRRLRAIYDDDLRDAGIATFVVPEHADPVLLTYPVRVRQKDQLLREAARRGFELGEGYNGPVDCPKALGLEAFAYRGGMCPEGERAANETVNLPMTGRTSERRARKIVEFLAKSAS